MAGALAAVDAGARQVQGTLNGLGERCGNADLTTLIPTLLLKPPMPTASPLASTLRVTRLSRASRLSTTS